MCAVRTSINIRYTYTASQNPCLTFNHHLSLFSVSALRPPSGVLISPPGSGTLVRLRPPLLVNSLSKINPSPHILPSHPVGAAKVSESYSKLLLTRKQVCVMTLERHSHCPQYPSMPYKYTPVSARLGHSSPPYPLTPLTFPLPFPFPFPFPFPSSTPPAPAFPLE